MRGRPKNPPGALQPRMRECLDLIASAGTDGIGCAALAGRMGVGLPTISTYTNSLRGKGLIDCTRGRGSVWRLAEPRKPMELVVAQPLPSVWAFAAAMGAAA